LRYISLGKKIFGCPDKWNLTFCLTSEWIFKFALINGRMSLPFNRLPDASKLNDSHNGQKRFWVATIFCNAGISKERGKEKVEK